MSVLFRDVIDGAKFRADLSTVGPGPHAQERVTDSEWRFLCNESVTSAWRLASSARPDFQVTSFDFSLTSGGSASVALPAGFFGEIDVCFSPDTAGEYSLGGFQWANRRAPGGWFPANFGGTTNYGGNSIRIMGNTLFVEPSFRAGGNYRLWYCPQPKLIRADFTVALATAAALSPGNVSAGGPGIGKTLTGSANSVLTVDGVVVTNGQIILVKNQANPIDNGIYTVTSAGSGASPYVLTRSNVTTNFTSTLGTMVQVTAGATNTDLFFETTSLTTVVDVTAWTWAEAFIDPILEQFAELLKITTAIPAMLRDDDLDPSKLILRAYGPDGMGGLTGEMKSYLRQVRTGGTVAKIIDCDARGPRSPWSI